MRVALSSTVLVAVLTCQSLKMTEAFVPAKTSSTRGISRIATTDKSHRWQPKKEIDPTMVATTARRKVLNLQNDLYNYGISSSSIPCSSDGSSSDQFFDSVVQVPDHHQTDNPELSEKSSRKQQDKGRKRSRQSDTNNRTRTNQSLLLSLCLSAMVLFSPLSQVQPAHADFGPSSAATTQPIPGLTRPQIQDKDIGGKKLKQLIGSTIDESRLEAFSTQLDDVIDGLRQRKETASTGEGYGYTSLDEEELLNAVQLQAQIESREKLLEKLEAQPYWFNYLAAFIGSVASTLVMHPVDTIKTRLQIADGTANDEDDEEEKELISLTTASPTNGYRVEDHLVDDEEVEIVPLVASSASTERVTGRSTSSITYNMTDLGQQREYEMDTAAAVAVLTRHEEDEELLETSEENELTAEPILRVENDAAATTTTTEQEEEDFFKLIASLYVGLTGNLLKEGPPSALYLGVYESVKYSLLPRISSPELLLLVYLVAGAAGEMVGSVVRAPAEAVKSLVQSKAAGTAVEAVEQIAGSAQGRANVLRAWSASIWRDVPFGAIQLAIFELVKAYILNNPNIDFDSSTLSSEAIIGAFAGGCGAFLTNPADVITTRIITQSTDYDEDDEEQQQPLGFAAMGRQIYEEGGVGAFFTGWQARVGYWAPAISLFLTCYCSVRQAGVRYDFFG